MRKAIEVDGGSVVFCAVYCRSGVCRGGRREDVWRWKAAEWQGGCGELALEVDP